MPWPPSSPRPRKPGATAAAPPLGQRALLRGGSTAGPLPPPAGAASGMDVVGCWAWSVMMGCEESCTEHASGTPPCAYARARHPQPYIQTHLEPRHRAPSPQRVLRKGSEEVGGQPALHRLRERGVREGVHHQAVRPLLRTDGVCFNGAVTFPMRAGETEQAKGDLGGRSRRKEKKTLACM